MNSRRVPRTATRAATSVVVVSDSRRDYCSGVVVVKLRTSAGTPGHTLVVAPTRFVWGKKGLRVRFDDGVQSPATVVAEEGPFTLLRTAAHSGCEAVKFLEESEPSPFVPRRTFVMAPISPTEVRYQRAYATLESLESYLGDCNCLDVSRGYFLVSCNYSERTLTGATRLAGSPVFTIDNGVTNQSGLAMGIVLQVTDVGNDRMKVVVTSTHFKSVLQKLDPPPPPRKRPPPPPPPRKRPPPPRKQDRLSGGKPFIGVRKGERGGKRRKLN